MLEESILKLSAQLSTINRNQKYFRTRENRNFSTVRSTERRIFNFSVIEGVMMVSMAGLQVFIVRFFFQGARKGESARAGVLARGGGADLCRVCVMQTGGLALGQKGNSILKRERVSLEVGGVGSIARQNGRRRLRQGFVVDCMHNPMCRSLIFWPALLSRMMDQEWRANRRGRPEVWKPGNEVLVVKCLQDSASNS